MLAFFWARKYAKTAFAGVQKDAPDEDSESLRRCVDRSSGYQDSPKSSSVNHPVENVSNMGVFDEDGPQDYPDHHDSAH